MAQLIGLAELFLGQKQLPHNTDKIILKKSFLTKDVFLIPVKMSYFLCYIYELGHASIVEPLEIQWW